MAQATIDTTVAGLQGVPVSPAVPTAGQALVFNGTVWIPTNPPAVLPLSGGTLTGPLVLSGNAVAALNPVTLQQLQANYLLLTGGTITGALTVDGNITTPNSINATGASNVNGTIFTQGNIEVNGGSISIGGGIGGQITFYGGGQTWTFYTSQANALTLNCAGAPVNNMQFFNNASVACWLGLNIAGGPNPGAAWTLGCAGIGSFVGNVEAPNFVQTSDPRTKIITGQYTSGLEQILSLSPITYRHNGKGRTPNDPETRVRIGLDASACKRTAPTIATVVKAHMNPVEPGHEAETPETEFDGIDHSALLMTLINAVKELAAQVASLRGAK